MFDPDTPSQAPVGYQDRNVKKEDLLELLDDISNHFPSMPTFEILRLYFSQPREVCPTSLLDDASLFLLEAEQSCREYYQLPFDGGVWDQPQKLIQAFSHIRTERNQYERARMDKLTKKDKKSSKNDEGSFSSPNLDLPPRNANLNI